jgi:hypothetical protein
MQSTRFNSLTRALDEGRSRRKLLGLIAGSSLSWLGLDLAEAKKKRKRKKRKKGDKCKGKCGGSCPRCSAGSSCDDRNECTTALCADNVCTEPVDGDDCGLDTDGDTCFARDAIGGDRYCSRKTCRFLGAVSCSQCTGQEICSPAGGDDIECCLPCGSPLA